MYKEIFANRREKLRKLLQNEKLDALLVSQAANRYYLSGFELHDGQCNESSGYLLICADGRDYLYTDSRFYEVAKTLWEEENIFIYSSPLEDMRLHLKKVLGSQKLGMESKDISHYAHTHLVNGLSLVEADGLVEELREIKDAYEIDCLEKSLKLNHQMFAWLPSILKDGLSESQVAYHIERYFRENGASELSFPCIVGKDIHAARPHHCPQDDVLLTENCHLLIDVGARYKNYCSDQTRTFWVGDKIDPKFEVILNHVKQAQALAIKKLAPGVSGKEVHLVALEYFKKYNLDKLFTHSLGHGIGLEVHEEPRLSMRSEKIMQPGMVVTVEPGLYYPDYGGVRWEYVVLITQDGHKVL